MTRIFIFNIWESLPKDENSGLFDYLREEFFINSMIVSIVLMRRESLPIVIIHVEGTLWMSVDFQTWELILAFGKSSTFLFTLELFSDQFAWQTHQKVLQWNRSIPQSTRRVVNFNTHGRRKNEHSRSVKYYCSADSESTRTAPINARSYQKPSSRNLPIRPSVSIIPIGVVT